MTSLVIFLIVATALASCAVGGFLRLLDERDVARQRAKQAEAHAAEAEAELVKARQVYAAAREAMKRDYDRALEIMVGNCADEWTNGGGQ